MARVHRVGTRTVAAPWGTGADPVEEDGNAHARFCRKVIVACLAVGCRFILEHPSSSYLWKTLEYQALALQDTVHLIRLDQCMFGAVPPDLQEFDCEGDVRTKKPTHLLTNLGSLRRFGAM